MALIPSMHVFLVLCALAVQSPNDGVVVAPGGSDSAAGTAAAPFATIQKAVEAARASGPKKIVLRGGT